MGEAIDRGARGRMGETIPTVAHTRVNSAKNTNSEHKPTDRKGPAVLFTAIVGCWCHWIQNSELMDKILSSSLFWTVCPLSYI